MMQPVASPGPVEPAAATNGGDVVALIGDLVGSREHSSRRAVQAALEAALDIARHNAPAVQDLEPTIGDEFQGVFASVAAASRAAAFVRLALPEGMDARMGLGTGTIDVVGESAYGLTQDGPAWWAAREAVTAVKDREHRIPGLRTRWHRHETAAPHPVTEEDPALVNAYLLCRDEILGRLDGRGRRILLGLLDGRTATQIARDESISVSAVSQRVRGDGTAAVLAALGEWPR